MQDEHASWRPDPTMARRRRAVLGRVPSYPSATISDTGSASTPGRGKGRRAHGRQTRPQSKGHVGRSGGL